MTEKRKNIDKVPNLRFPEFSGEWEARKLKEITTYVDYRGKAPIKTDEGHFLVTAKNIKKGFIDYECSKEYVSKEDYSNVMSKGFPKLGDVLFTTEAPMGNVAQIDNEDIALAQRVIKFSAKRNLTNSYLLHYMLSNVFQKTISKKAIGTTVQGISGKDLHRISISFPTLVEQRKIADFLSVLDFKIQTQKKTIQDLETLIKGVSQKLSTQKIRFKEFTDEWKEVKLGKIGETFNGLTGKTKDDFGQGKPYIQYKQIFDSTKIQIQDCELVEISEKDNQNCVKYGDIFFTTSSETPNEIGMSSVLLNEVDEMYLNSFCFGYRIFSFEILTPLFASFFFRSSVFRNKIVKLAQGSTRYNMSKVELMKLSISLPFIKEQIKIADFLSKISDKIETEKKILGLLEQQKKYFLQNLFI